MRAAPTPHGLHFVPTTPVTGLAVAERRVVAPEATIICVHGGLDRGGSFARLARRTDRFDLVTYDRRGYQGSRDLAPLGLTYHVGDLVALARAEPHGRAIIFFGHSFGGVIALAAAVQEPSLARLVITYEAPLPWIRRRQGTAAPSGSDPQREAERFFRRIVSDSAWDRLGNLERDSRRRDGPALVSDLSSLHAPRAPFDLAALRVPSVYVYGDVLAPEFYRTLSADLATLNPLIESRQVLHAAHGAHLSIPDQLAALIAELWDTACASA